MNGVIDFYQKLLKPQECEFQSGLFCTAPIPFILESQPKRLILDYHDSEKPQNSSYQIEKTDFITFNPRNDKSLRHLGLEQDHYLLTVGYKNRLSIILSDPIDYTAQVTQGFLVAPLFSTHDKFGNFKNYINQEIIERAQSYDYKHIFYLPESSDYSIRESFVRLDRLVFVRLDHIFPKNIMMTNIALDLLRQWSWYYQGAPLFDSALEEYIKISKQKLNEKYTN